MDIIKQREARAEFLFRRADHFELSLCQRLNRMGHMRAIRLFFKGVSRLGDGVFWYSLALALPLLVGMEGLAKLGHITVAGLVCILVYSQHKNRLVRKRPFISFPDIHAHTAPLDKYSFPSGHTMNAVNFAVLFTWAYPPLAYIVIPFAFLVALSRVILGMHYPTDVVVGAALGIILSWTSLLLFPLGMFANVLN